MVDLRGPRRAGACLAWLAPLLSAGAAPLTFNTALPVAAGEFVYRGQVVVDRSGHDPGPADRERTEIAGISALGYGAGARLALFGVLPWADRKLERDAVGGRVSREAQGPGDLSLFARYTLLKRDGPGRTFRLAPFAGVELPTGREGARDALGRVPARLQPGSGSTDVFGGVVATWQTLDWQVDLQSAVRRNGEGNGFRAGGELRLDGSLQYRLWPRRLGRGTPGFLYAVLEAGIARLGRNETGGVEDRDSGGLVFTLTPGVQYVTRRWILEGGVSLPLAQNLNGSALESGHVVRAGFRVNF